jgi:hypothetical protein
MRLSTFPLQRLCFFIIQCVTIAKFQSLDSFIVLFMICRKVFRLTGSFCAVVNLELYYNKMHCMQEFKKIKITAQKKHFLAKMILNR